MLKIYILKYEVICSNNEHITQEVKRFTEDEVRQLIANLKRSFKYVDFKYLKVLYYDYKGFKNLEV